MDPDPPSSDQPSESETESSPGGAAPPVRPPTITGYELVRKLGEGGQGAVYQAIQNSTGQQVAIKVLHRPGIVELDERFEQEIRLLAQLSHPNIVTVFDSGRTADGRRYLVMDYVHGVPLRGYVRAHGLALNKFLALFQETCRAVEHAHHKGIIHRDLKPGNILVDATGQVKLLDFGVARCLAVGEVSGEAIGTPAYMSPEQRRGNSDEIDARSDVYSLGVILYEVLTGQHPYLGTPDVSGSRPRPPTLVWTPSHGIAGRGDGGAKGARCPLNWELETIVLACLAQERDGRYDDAGDLAADIGRYLRGEPIERLRGNLPYILFVWGRRLVERRRVAILVAGIVIVSALAVGISVPLLYRWTTLGEWFVRHAGALLPAVLPPSGFEHVRVIGLADSTDVAALARGDGIAGVSWESITSVRRLHGRLMAKLARSRCQCVAWDIEFPGETEFDADFVSGVSSLRKAGIDVIAGVSMWWLDTGRPGLSPTIAREVRWGGTGAGLGHNVPWVLQLVAQRGPADPVPSLALAAFAAAQHPDQNLQIRLDPEHAEAEMTFWTPDPTVPNAKNWLAFSDRIRLTSVREGDDGTGRAPAREGLRDDDSVGLFVVEAPTDAHLAKATLLYEQVYTADEAKLQGWLADNVVLVCDLRSTSKDRFDTPDGRTLSGCYAHAAGIESLFRSASVRISGGAAGLTSVLIGGALGCLVGVAAARTLRRRLLAALGTSVVLILASAFAAWRAGYLLNPLIPILVVWVVCELSAAIQRTWLARRECLHVMEISR